MYKNAKEKNQQLKLFIFKLEKHALSIGEKTKIKG